jgi:hypothetical protein
MLEDGGYLARDYYSQLLGDSGATELLIIAPASDRWNYSGPRIKNQDYLTSTGERFYGLHYSALGLKDVGGRGGADMHLNMLLPESSAKELEVAFIADPKLLVAFIDATTKNPSARDANDGRSRTDQDYSKPDRTTPSRVVLRHSVDPNDPDVRVLEF